MHTTQSFEPILQHPIIQTVKELAQDLQAHIYLVGGALRDYVLTGNLPSDLDFMVLDQPAVLIAHEIAQKLNGRYVLLDESNGIHRVVIHQEADEDITLDLSDALENSLEKDLGRRDLTLNAMAFDLQNGTFWDPFNGLNDLDAKIIRMVSEENLVEDPLRLLRVFRFAAQLQATQIHPETLGAVTHHSEKLWIVAAERIQYEFLKFLSAPVCFPYLQIMGETGLLEVLLPELIETHNVPPNRHHHLWLFEHTLELVHQAEELLLHLSEDHRTFMLSPFNRYVSRFGLLKLGCLLHDIGKPETMAEGDAGKVTFYGHDILSETMTEVICQRLKVSSEITEHVKKLVRWHLYPCQFGPESSRKSVLRFFRRMGELVPDIVILALADRLSTRGPDISEADIQRSLHQHFWLLEQYEAERPTLQLPRLINGNDVMKLLNIPPGPQIREILESVQEAHQLGEIQTEEEAKRWTLERFQINK